MGRKCIRWERMETPLKERGFLQDEDTVHLLYHLTQETEVLQSAEERHARILDADYSKQDIDEFVTGLSHLTSEQKKLLKATLKKHDSLFKGGLGLLKIKPIRLELIPGATPYHARPFPVPQSLEAKTKKEMNRLTDINVFERCHDSEWAAPTFVQPKKTGDIRILTDFRKLNAVLKRKPFPLPKISDLLQKLSGFKWATAIDLSMGYYHIPLDKESQRLCTTILPWGKYKYKRLPMGIKNSPDIFQSIMMDLMGDIEFARTYLDDILITSAGSFEDHMAKLDKVLKRLARAGFRANVKKCFFAEASLEYLGYQLTRKGVQPQPKKVEAILRIAPPRTKRQLRHFLGMINFYRDVWRRRSHILAPLTAMVSAKAKFDWGKKQQQAFDTMKRVMSKQTLLTFPDFNKEFHIYTDASDYQLGAVIMQDGKPLAFYSRKMNQAQRNYTTGEQELLSIVETLKEFRNILLGQKLIVHTDHKNIVYGNLSNARIARWRLLLEEFGPQYVHIAGKKNIVADALSRMEVENGQPITLEDSDAQPQLFAGCMAAMTRDVAKEIPEGWSNQEMSYAFGEEEKEEEFPMNPQLIARHQQKDNELQHAIQKGKKEYRTKDLEGSKVVFYKGKIVIPKPLRQRIIDWYHFYLCHPGVTRMEATLRQTMIWPKMRENIHRTVRHCREYQLCKKWKKKYGKVARKGSRACSPVATCQC